MHFYTFGYIENWVKRNWNTNFEITALFILSTRKSRAGNSWFLSLEYEVSILHCTLCFGFDHTVQQLTVKFYFHQFGLLTFSFTHKSIPKGVEQRNLLFWLVDTVEKFAFFGQKNPPNNFATAKFKLFSFCIFFSWTKSRFKKCANVKKQPLIPNNNN